MLTQILFFIKNITFIFFSFLAYASNSSQNVLLNHAIYFNLLNLLKVNTCVLKIILFILFFFCVFTSIRATMPRIRIDLLLDFFWKYLIILALFVLILTFCLILMFNLNCFSIATNILCKQIFLFLKKINFFLKNSTILKFVITNTFLVTNRYSYYYLFILNSK